MQILTGDRTQDIAHGPHVGVKNCKRANTQVHPPPSLTSKIPPIAGGITPLE